MEDNDNINLQLQILQQNYEALVKTKTLSLMIGESVLNARRSVKELLLLPFRLNKLKKDFLSGKIRPVISGSNWNPGKNMANRKKHMVLFMATNGVGLGHLTRCLSVARKMKKKLGTKEIVFLTTCPALHLIWNEGFIPFYVPSKEMFKKDISGEQWDVLLASAFDSLCCLYDFDLIIFDGAVPYNSLISVLEKFNHTIKIWIRRGSTKKGTDNIRQRCEDFFDYIILPSEAGDVLEVGNEKYIHVEPIVYLDSEEQMDRIAARKLFGANKDQKLIYVQLGAGKINDTEHVMDTVIEVLLEDPGNLIVLGQSPLGDNLPYIDDRIILIKDYPNAKFFKGIDMAVSATGYNSFHELMSSNVPTVYIPNTNTGTDDQTARALRSEKYGLGIVVTNPTRSNLREAISKLLRCAPSDVQLNFKGSQQTADCLIEIYNNIEKH